MRAGSRRAAIWMTAVMVAFMATVAATGPAALAKKKQSKGSTGSPKASLSTQLQKARNDYAEARKALQAAQRQWAQMLRDLEQKKQDSKADVDRSYYDAAVAELREAKKYVESLTERMREQLKKENPAYAEAVEKLWRARRHYETLAANETDPKALLEAMKAMDPPAAKVDAIEQQALVSNDHIKEALRRVAEAEETVGVQRLGLADQLKGGRVDPSLRNRLKAAAAAVSKARLAAAEKADAVARLEDLVKPEAPTIKLLVINKDNSKKHKKKNRKRKKKKKN